MRQRPQRKKYEERAKLVNGSDVPVMKIRLKVQEEEQAIPYKFEYWTSKEKCGIFIHTHGSTTPRCEQYAWNSQIGISDECDKAYSSICGSTSFLGYKYSCVDPNYLCVGLPSRC
ncbi:uncharacterized protein LOC142559634 isoform X1 [Dermacentor variabilis]|uniref:uncharacterized protein LOC142559634 isoform X1 n=1 Tax=Dermacentor variabilis TaxID=34621 RepID=UPI003F5B2C80